MCKIYLYIILIVKLTKFEQTSQKDKQQNSYTEVIIVDFVKGFIRTIGCEESKDITKRSFGLYSIFDLTVRIYMCNNKTCSKP